MNDPYCIFVDSDVIISSLLSTTGASYLLLHHEMITPFISDISTAELAVVVKRLGIHEKMFTDFMFSRLKVIALKSAKKHIQKKYVAYVYDKFDAHIVTGAVVAKTPFLISYNVRHYNCEKIKRDFGIIVYTPAMYLQYLRSI